MLSLYDALMIDNEESIIDEGFLGFGKKKTRWQRFKDALNRNKGKVAAGIIGAGLLGGAKIGLSRSQYNNYVKEYNKRAAEDGYMYAQEPGKDEMLRIEKPGKWKFWKSYKVPIDKDGTLFPGSINQPEEKK